MFARMRFRLLLAATLLVASIQSTSVWAQRTVEQAVRGSQAVFIGTLTKVTPRWGNPSRTWIETEYEFQVDDAIVADGRVQTGKTVTITRWGGQIGSKLQMLAGDAALAKGNRYVLMLNKHYAEPECRQPLVGREGILAIVKREGAEVVVAQRGEPVVLSENRVARYSELAGRKALAEPVSPAAFSKALKADLTRIRALPSAERKTYKHVASARSSHRPLSKAGVRKDISRLAKAAPQAQGVKGIRQPTPNASHTKHLASAKAMVSRSASPEVGALMTGEITQLPLRFNQFPADFDYAGVDENCMYFWNQFFPDMFEIYEEPLDDVGFGDGVSDVWGFVTDDELYDIAGHYFDDWPYVVHWWKNPDTGKIIEADIFFNAELDWTLDDVAVYNGEDERVSFERMMMQSLGWSVGLDISPGLAVMAAPDQLEFDGINQPQGDDIWNLDSLYPRSNNGPANLTITLASSPEAHQWDEASFDETAKAGGEMTVGGYFLCNLGVGSVNEPKVDWYLCAAQNWDERFIYLGSATYPTLHRGGWFYVDEGIERTLAIPADTPPGDYYLGAFIPGEENITVHGFFPISTDSAFSRSTIKITKD